MVSSAEKDRVMDAKKEYLVRVDDIPGAALTKETKDRTHVVRKNAQHTGSLFKPKFHAELLKWGLAARQSGDTFMTMFGQKMELLSNKEPLSDGHVVVWVGRLCYTADIKDALAAANAMPYQPEATSVLWHPLRGYTYAILVTDNVALVSPKKKVEEEEDEYDSDSASSEAEEEASCECVACELTFDGGDVITENFKALKESAAVKEAVAKGNKRKVTFPAHLVSRDAVKDCPSDLEMATMEECWDFAIDTFTYEIPYVPEFYFKTLETQAALHQSTDATLAKAAVTTPPPAAAPPTPMAPKKRKLASLKEVAAEKFFKRGKVVPRSVFVDKPTQALKPLGAPQMLKAPAQPHANVIAELRDMYDGARAVKNATGTRVVTSVLSTEDGVDVEAKATFASLLAAMAADDGIRSAGTNIAKKFSAFTTVKDYTTDPHARCMLSMAAGLLLKFAPEFLFEAEGGPQVPPGTPAA